MCAKEEVPRGRARRIMEAAAEHPRRSKRRDGRGETTAAWGGRRPAEVKEVAASPAGVGADDRGPHLASLGRRGATREMAPELNPPEAAAGGPRSIRLSGGPSSIRVPPA
jgi:hypothetical protein